MFTWRRMLKIVVLASFYLYENQRKTFQWNIRCKDTKKQSISPYMFDIVRYMYMKNYNYLCIFMETILDWNSGNHIFIFLFYSFLKSYAIKTSLQGLKTQNCRPLYNIGIYKGVFWKVYCKKSAVILILILSITRILSLGQRHWPWCHYRISWLSPVKWVRHVNMLNKDKKAIVNFWFYYF